MKHILFRSLVGIALFSLAGCAAKRVETVNETPKPAPVAVTPKQNAMPVAATDEKGEQVPELQDATLYFGFDESTLSSENTSVLAHVAEVMRKNPAVKVTIAGHADERGTTEYNLALGNRRAEVAKQYLVTLGVEPGRVNTLSYGEERPAQNGQTDEAFAANRRDEIAPR